MDWNSCMIVCACSPAEELGARQESSTRSASPLDHTQRNQAGKYLCWIVIKLRNCPQSPSPIVPVTEMPLLFPFTYPVRVLLAQRLCAARLMLDRIILLPACECDADL
jgi:hypothetical protein